MRRCRSDELYQFRGDDFLSKYVLLNTVISFDFAGKIFCSDPENYNFGINRASQLYFSYIKTRYKWLNFYMIEFAYFPQHEIRKKTTSEINWFHSILSSRHTLFSDNIIIVTQYILYLYLILLCFFSYYICLLFFFVLFMYLFPWHDIHYVMHVIQQCSFWIC